MITPRGADDHRGGQHQGLRRHDERRGGTDDHRRKLQGSDTANFIETYSTRNVGTGMTLTPSGTVNDGNGGNNYTYTFDPVSTGVITAEALTITAVANTKTYDGTTSAAASADDHLGQSGHGSTRPISPRPTAPRTWARA